MAETKTTGDLFSEDVVIGAGVTYVVGGISIALTKCTSLSRIIHAQLKAPTGSTAATNVQVAPKVGSEVATPPSFTLRAFQVGSAVSTPFAELAAASTALEGLTVSVLYEGSA